MCRNIRILHNFEPPATDEEIAAAALQFVRKVSGFRAPSRRNAEAFDEAVAEVQAASKRLLGRLPRPERPLRSHVRVRTARPN
jgi:hypothetical protein